MFPDTAIARRAIPLPTNPINKKTLRRANRSESEPHKMNAGPDARLVAAAMIPTARSGPPRPSGSECQVNDVRDETHRGGWDDQEGRRPDRLPRLPTENIHEERDIEQAAADSHAPGQEAGTRGRRGGPRHAGWRHRRIIVLVDRAGILHPVPNHEDAEYDQHGREERLERLLAQHLQREDGPHNGSQESPRKEDASEAEVDETAAVMVDDRRCRGREWQRK